MQKAGYHWFTGPGPRGKGTRYFLYKMIRCGRKHCHKCPHGPYLYERVLTTSGSRTKKREYYIGKEGSEKEQAILAYLLACEAHLEATVPF